MAKTKISELDAAAANNTDINSVDVSEGCAPSGINNAIREMGAMLKRMDVGTDALTSPDINGGSIDGATIGTNSVITDLRVDNLKLDANTISSTDTDGDITLDPNGTGKVNVVGELEADSLDIDGNGTIDGSLTITTADNTAQLIVKSTDDDASVGPLIELYRDSASPAVSDSLGRIEWKGKNDLGQDVTYSFIDTFIRDETDTTEDGELRFIVMRDGTAREALMLGQDSVVFNEGGSDINFRVESDNQASMFFVDGGNDRIGINNASPTYLIDAFGTGTGDNSDTVMRIKAQGTGDSDVLLLLDAADTGESIISFLNDGNDEASIEWNSTSPQLNIRTASGTNGPIDIQPNNVLTARFETNGDLTLEDGNLVIGTAGHGIDFSATSNGSGTMQNELLDDYEEGTWSPVAATNSGSAASFTAGTSIYTKIGRMVFVRGSVNNINTSGTGSGNTFRITGLPFTIDVVDSYGSMTYDQITLQGSRTQINPDFDTAEFVRFVQSGGGTGETGTDHNDLVSGATDIFFTGFYFTNQ